MPSTLSTIAISHPSSNNNTFNSPSGTDIHNQQQQQQQQYRSSITMDHDRDQDPLYPVNLHGGTNTNTGNGNGNSNSNSYNGHPPAPSAPLLYHQPTQHHHHSQEMSQGLLSPAQQPQQAQQQQQQQQQHFNNAQHHIYPSQHNNHGDYHGYHPDLQKPISHPLDIYQTPAQPQDQALLNPLINRQLNSHTTSFQTPHHPQHPYQHHHHSQQQQQYYPHYHYQQQQQHLKAYSDPHSDPTAPPTPASTAASTMTAGSSSSTPSLPPSTSALPYQSGDYPHLGLPLAMPTWTTTNASPSEQDMQPRQPQPSQQQPQSQPQQQPPHPQQQQHPSYPQPARDLAQLGSLKAGDRASYYQSPPPPGQIPAHLYSQQSHDPHHHHQQDQQQQSQQPQQATQQHNTPTWVGNMSSDSFHSPPDFLEHPDRQHQKQQRIFTPTDNTAHPTHDPAYASGGGYFDNDRTRGQPTRQPLGRGLMEYSDGYHGHAPDPALASQQAGMASMDGLPLMSPTHPLHTDPHGQAFSHISLLNSGNAAHKSLSASLDSVPMGLGPPGMMSHPNYGSVASYISSTPMAKGATASSSPATTVTRPPPQKSQSAQHAGQNKSHKKRRTRTSSMTSSSSIASSGIMSSITSTLGATNISSFTDSPSGINSAQHHHHHHSSSSVPNLSVPPSILGGPDFSNESGAGGSGNMAFHGLAAATGSNAGSSTASSPTSGKPRPGGHPRTAVAARVFECSFPGCNKAYTQLHNLKSHERTGHTPIQKPRPFLCIIPGCTKAFSQRKSLALHIRASHKEYKFKPFKCSQQGCDKSYTQLHNLRTHEKTVHMLDLSRKRIRNPLPYPGTEGGGSAGGGGMDGMQGDGSSMMMVGLQGSSSGDRDQFPGGVGLSYESIDDLKDFSGARMPGHAENEERGSGQYQRGGGNGGGGRDELADVEEEEDDGDYIDE